MKIHYLEIVTRDVDQVCLGYERTGSVSFSPPVAELGNARTAQLPDASVVGVRAPMGDMETPVTRPYWLVDNIEQAVKDVADCGAEIIHPPLEIPGKGTFAIFSQGGNQQGFWQL
ncbi:MAG: VOC family protein [Lysobacterales bacterium]